MIQVKIQEKSRFMKSLSEEKITEPTMDNPEKFVVNLWSCTLNKTQTKTLAYGSKFCIQQKRENQNESQARFEIVFDQLSKLKLPLLIPRDG